MNLIADIGNTRVKIAVYGDSGQTAYYVFGQNRKLDEVRSFLSGYSFTNGLVSNVKNDDEHLFEVLKENCPGLKVLTHKTPLPFRISYDTPETLGSDRIALAAGAQKYGDVVMAVDAGTCITYDIVANGVYFGGAITPGIMMRFKAMHRFTEKLPEINSIEKPQFPGKSTQESMQSAGINAVAHEINGFAGTFKEQYPHGKVILTGGDAIHLVNRLKNHTFANCFLQMEGLNEILNYRIRK